MKKGTALWEMLLTMAMIAVFMGVALMGYRTMLYRFSLNSEVLFVKKYLEFAQEKASVFQRRTRFEIKDELIQVVLIEDDRPLKRHFLAKKVRVIGPNIEFTERLTPVKGGTIKVYVGNLERSVIVDPSTGRIRKQ